MENTMVSIVLSVVQASCNMDIRSSSIFLAVHTFMSEIRWDVHCPFAVVLGYNIWYLIKYVCIFSIIVGAWARFLSKTTYSKVSIAYYIFWTTFPIYNWSTFYFNFGIGILVCIIYNFKILIYTADGSDLQKI